MAESTYEVLRKEPPQGGAAAPSRGATDPVGMGQRIASYHSTVERVARGDDASSVSLDEARQQLCDAQSALTSLGYMTLDHAESAGDAANGWGPDTQEALANFQDDYGLDGASGHLDGETYEALMSVYEQALQTCSRGDDVDDLSMLPHADAED